MPRNWIYLMFTRTINTISQYPWLNPELIMALLLLLLLLVLVALPLFLVRKHRVISVDNGGGEQNHLPPGPPRLPFVGNLHQLVSMNIINKKSSPDPLYVNLCHLAHRYGPIMSLRLGCRPTLVLSSARMAKLALKDHDLQFCSRPSLFSMQRICYNGLNLSFAPYGWYWREMRKICVVHLFSSKKVHFFRSIREDEVSNMIGRISRSASAAKLTNLSEIVMLLTSNIICRIGFGKKYKDEGCERSRFQELLNETQAVAGSFFFADYFPVMGWWLDCLTGVVRRLEKNFKKMDMFLQEMIEEHLDPRRPETAEHEDIIDVLLRVRRDKSFSEDLTWNHIKGILLDIFVAGTDTGAAILVWAMAEMMKNPKVMKKAQDEVRNAYGSKGFIDEDGLDKLPYIKAVLKEALRLHPPAPLLVPRQTLEKCSLEGYEIPPETLVFVNGWAVGRDPEAWENPQQFSPERFLGNSTQVDFRGHDYQLIPFGAGRRICPGIHLGVATVELALANLLYLFDWEMPCGMNKDDIDMEAKPGVTVHKRNPLCLQAKQYNFV